MLNPIDDRIYTQPSLVTNDNIYVVTRLTIARRSENRNLPLTKFEFYIRRKADDY